MELSQVTIRECTIVDSEQIANLYNKFGYGPVKSGYVIQTSDIQRLFAQSDIVLFLCLEYENIIIGTMLFSTICGQKAADPHSVWGSKFFIHPQFRNGPLPGILFSESIKRLTELDYKYIDVDVDPTNSNALPLYKRVGFIRHQNSFIDYDGYIELRSYLPLIINFLKKGYQVETVDDSLMESGWKSLLSVKDVRSFNRDTYDLFGMETYKYEMKFGEDVISCWVDMKTEHVAIMEDSRFRFCSYILEGQQLNISQEVTIKFEYENHLDQRILVTFDTKIGNRKLAYKNGKNRKLLNPGESVKWEEKAVITSQMEGMGSLQTSIKFGNCAFDFHYGFNALESIDVVLDEQSSIVVNRPALIQIAIKNNTSRPFEGYVKISQDDFTTEILENSKKPMHININKYEETLLPVQLLCARSGLNRLQVLINNENQEFIVAKDIVVQVLSSFSTITYSHESFSYLENHRLKVMIDHKTGGLVIVERVTGEEVVREAWPDLGLPFKGSIKRMPKRDILVFEIVEENALALVEIKNEYIHLIRKVYLGSESMVKIEDYAIGNGNILKIHPWCTIKNPIISIPFKSGTMKETYVYEDYPFLTNDFEYMSDFDLPSDPNAYAMPWSQFENNDMSVGLIWDGEAESIQYGLRWMPSIVFKRISNIDLNSNMFTVNQYKNQFFPLLNKQELQKNKSLKKFINKFLMSAIPDTKHYYYVGYTSGREVEYTWKSLVGDREEISEQIGRVKIVLDMPEVVKNGETLNLIGSLDTEHLSDITGVLEMVIPDLSIHITKSVEPFDLKHSFSVPFSFEVQTDKIKIDGEIIFKNEEKGIIINKKFHFFVIDKNTRVQIEQQKKKSFNIFSVNNGCLEFEVSADQQASVISMKYQSKNLVSSYFPSLKSWGQNTSIPAGIYPHRLKHEINVEQGMIFDSSHIETFTGKEIKSNLANNENWQGVRCIGQDYSIEYLTLPNTSIVKVDVSFTSGRSSENFVLNFFGNKFSKERKVYYWDSTGPKIMKESKIRRRVSSNLSKAVIDLGNNFYISVIAVEEIFHLVLTEWPDKGIQLSLLYPTKRKRSDNINDQCSIYLIASRSLKEAMDYLN